MKFPKMEDVTTPGIVVKTSSKTNNPEGDRVLRQTRGVMRILFESLVTISA
jgi:hypothetical protein